MLRDDVSVIDGLLADEDLGLAVVELVIDACQWSCPCLRVASALVVVSRAHVIQVETHAWLVVNDVFTPRFVVRYLPAVNRATHETIPMYRVQRWQLEPSQRETIGWHDTLAEAEAQCRDLIEKPDMATPIRDGYGSAITPQDQRRRWDVGLDPRTGEPRET